MVNRSAGGLRPKSNFYRTRATSIPVALVQGQGASSPTTPVKATIDTAWKCGAPESVSSLPVPGRTDRTFSIYTVNCTATKGQVGGVKETTGTATEFTDATGNSNKGHGVFVETLENADTVTYTYQSTATVNNKILQTGSNTWTMGGGTGKMKGINGSGSCKAKGNADGSADFVCTGSYTMAK